MSLLLRAHSAGDASQDANWELVNERLPWELGWTTRVNTVKLRDVLFVSDMIKNASSLMTVVQTERTIFSSAIYNQAKQKLVQKHLAN